MKTKRAFTLTELLVVIAIIAILALLVSVAAAAFQKKAQITQSLANLKQLSSGLLVYTGSHEGELPKLGVPQPAWGIADEKDREAWYQAIPKAAGGRALSDYTKPDTFYQKDNILFLPSAKYPHNKTSQPYFAVAINASLYGNADARKDPDKVPVIRLSNLQLPVSTVVFLEVGMPDEETLPGQNSGNYRGSAHGGPLNAIARYNKVDSKDTEKKREATINIVFGDGHVDAVQAKDAIDSSGNAYNPQLQQFGGEGKICWTLDPESTP
jgi:prepilin-type N-terminal cleavage/methylation domain-containing protein/prepilin-type processing-associated H-X9-DG protein